MPNPMRLDKFLSHNLELSRKQAQQLIRAKRVQINQRTETNASTKLEDTDEVILDQEVIQALGSIYLMLNKPQGYVCANTDNVHPSVLSLIDLPRASELIICGRLDVDTTGLVLITNDGQWAHRVTSPQHKTHKHYRVTTKAPLKPELIEQFAQGIKLKQDEQLTAPTKLIIHSNYEAEVHLTEGRYHQVKRMFAAVDNRVLELNREQIAGIRLDKDLALAEYRTLTDDEINSV